MFELDEITDGGGQCMTISYIEMQPGRIDIGFRLNDAIYGYLQSGAVSFKFGDLRTTGYMLCINRVDDSAVIICSPHLLRHNNWNVGDNLTWEFEPGNTTLTFTKAS